MGIGLDRVSAARQYCYRKLYIGIFQSHPYFGRAFKAYDRIELAEFLSRYQTFLGRVPTRDENAKRVGRILSQREKTILLSRAGIQGGYQTLDEIKQNMGVSRERIRQLHDRSLRILRRYTGLLDALYTEETGEAEKI